MSLRTLAALGAVLAVSVVLLFGAAAVGLTTALGGSATALSADATPSHDARSAIPHTYLQAFEAAAASCPGLPWSVLAGIGRVETDFGADTQTSSAGAVVIYRWDGGLWHLRNEATGGRGSLVSEGSLARGQGGGHSGFIGSPAHDDQISSVASGVSI